MSHNRTTSWLADARQWLQPREFRIQAEPLPPPSWEAVQTWASALHTPAAEATAPTTPTATDPSRESDARRERTRFLAALATGLWRLRKRMHEPGTERPREALRREYRHLEAVWDLLADARVKVIDHTGQPFDPGQRLEVAGQVELPGLTRPRVQETVTPTVYVDDEHVQWGVVLVENPVSPPP